MDTSQSTISGTAQVSHTAALEAIFDSLSIVRPQKVWEELNKIRKKTTIATAVEQDEEDSAERKEPTVCGVGASARRAPGLVDSPPVVGDDSSQLSAVRWPSAAHRRHLPWHHRLRPARRPRPRRRRLPASRRRLLVCDATALLVRIPSWPSQIWRPLWLLR